MRKSKPRTETRASQSRELGELSALARETVERKHKDIPNGRSVVVDLLSGFNRSVLLFLRSDNERDSPRQRLCRKQ